MSKRSEYYQRRLAQELIAARKAICPEAAAAHRRLAELYSDQVESESAISGDIKRS